MKLLRYLICGILLTASGLCGADDRIVTAVTRNAGGRIEISVSNHYRFPITAFVVLANHTPLVSGVVRHVSIRYMDSVFSPLHAPSIAPNDSHTIVLGGALPGPDKEQVDVELKAAIFADGSTFGEADWIDGLIRGRRSLYRSLNEVIEALRAARGTGVPASDVRQTIQTTERTELDASQDPEEKRGIGQAFENAIANLEPLVDNGAQLSTDDKIDFAISMLIESRQRVQAAKPNVVEAEK